MSVSFVPSLLASMFNKPLGFMTFWYRRKFAITPRHLFDFDPYELKNWVLEEDNHKNDYPVLLTVEEAFRFCAEENLKEYAQQAALAHYSPSPEAEMKWRGVFMLGNPQFVYSHAEFSEVSLVADAGFGQVQISSTCPVVYVPLNEVPNVGVAYGAEPSGKPLFSNGERWEALRAMGLTRDDDLFTDERIQARGAFLNKPIEGIAQPKPKKPAKPKAKRKTTAA